MPSSHFHDVDGDLSDNYEEKGFGFFNILAMIL